MRVNMPLKRSASYAFIEEHVVLYIRIYFQVASLRKSLNQLIQTWNTFDSFSSPVITSTALNSGLLSSDFARRLAASMDKEEGPAAGSSSSTFKSNN